jgi:hypothetical protein
MEGNDRNYCKRVFWNLMRASINPNGTYSHEWYAWVEKTRDCDNYADLQSTRYEIREYKNTGTSYVSLYTDYLHDVRDEIEQKFTGFTRRERMCHWFYKMFHKK